MTDAELNILRRLAAERPTFYGLYLQKAVEEIERLKKLNDAAYALVMSDSAARDNLRNQLLEKDDEIQRLRTRLSREGRGG